MGRKGKRPAGLMREEIEEEGEEFVVTHPDSKDDELILYALQYII